MRQFSSDLLHSLRTLRKSPGYALVAILLFALGIGANTAIFNVANAVLLRPLPYAEPGRLVVTLHQGDAPVSPADFHDYQTSSSAFQQMGAAEYWGGTLDTADQRERVPGIRLTASLIELLGVAPMLGRGFTEVNEHEGHSHVLLLSYGLWKSRFGGDPGIVGREIALDRVPYTVVGVMPGSFRFAPFWATRAQMWAPLDLDKRANDRDGRSLRVFARLKPGVSVAQAQSEMDAIAAHLASEYPQTNAKLGITVVPLLDKVVRGVRPTLLVLLGTVGFVLLIACATVGNLMLSRSVARRREMALRLAVGARRFDLVRMAMAEVLMLSVAGAAGGILLAGWALDILNATLPPGSMPRQAELGFDPEALIFAGAAALFSALLSGVLPAIQATRANLNDALKESSRGSSTGSGRLRSQSALVSIEVALSLLLMVGAGLMLRTMSALTSLDAGFNPHDVLTMQVAMSGTDSDATGRRAPVLRQVRERIAATPGVVSVSAVNHIPVGGDTWGIGYSIAGRPAPAPGDKATAVYRVTMPGYFETMKMHLLEGRDFTEHDDEHSPAVAVINETLARRQWSGESPIGKQIHYGLSKEDAEVTRTIVGVVKDVRQRDWIGVPDDEIYLPYFQRPDSMGLSYMTFVARTRDSSDSIVREVRSFNKNLSISEVAPMESFISGELWRQRLAAILIGSFAMVALLLAAAGIYGVISHSMRSRTQEIGIRIALGAKAGDLVRLALWEGMRPVLMGMFAGAVGALALTRLLQTLLYGVEARDVPTISGVIAVLGIVCVMANLFPAIRATRVDPIEALRHD